MSVLDHDTTKRVDSELERAAKRKGWDSVEEYLEHLNMLRRLGIIN